MVDPGTVLTVGGTAYFLKAQFDKIFGPTSEYLGIQIKDVVENRIVNVNKILLKTQNKLGDKIEEPGGIHPRIVERLLNSGSYIEDDLTQEYFAGVMATSRTLDGKDDRGLYFLDLIGKLSHLDLKVHYILYSKLREKHLGTDFSIYLVQHRHHLYNRLSIDDFFSEFQMYYHESYDRKKILMETAARLLKEDLLNEILIGPNKFIEKRAKELLKYQFLDISENRVDLFFNDYSLYEEFSGTRTKTPYPNSTFWDRLTKSTTYNQSKDPDVIDLLYTPSPLGAHLFLWAHGEGQLLANEIFNPNLILKSEQMCKKSAE